MRSQRFVSDGILLSLLSLVLYLREDFCPDSDIDVLVEFKPEFKRGLTETIQMKEELQEIVKRKVDFIVKRALKRSENWLRREKILASAKIIYVKRCSRF
jgi:predicted nucleotidyltransferase